MNARRRLKCVLALVATILSANVARAADQVLIMTVSDYMGQPLEGVVHDADNGLRLAQSLGFDVSAAVRLRDRQLTLAGMKTALENLIGRTRNGDRVFVYFSGHGGSKRQGDLCVQSLIAQDGQSLSTGEVHGYLERLKDTASKVMVMFDACYSGGVLSSVEQVRGGKDMFGSRVRAKAWAAKDGESCSTPVNLVTRALATTRSAKSLTDLSKNYIYLTAARENEAALDDPDRGGLASTALLGCLEKGVVDMDLSGTVSMDELVQCAQGQIRNSVDGINTKLPNSRAKWAPHRISAVGNEHELVLRAVPLRPATAGNDISPARVFQSILDSQDSRWGLAVTPSATQLRFGEKLQIAYKSNQGGYVYLLYAGSDGHEFQQIYPPGRGETRLLRASEGWVGRDGKRLTITITEPEGDNQFLVLLSNRPLDLSSAFNGGEGGALVRPVNPATAMDLACLSNGGRRNAVASEGTAPCIQLRNAIAAEESLQVDQALGGYGAALFTVRGVK
jgi:hypothetical protein